MSRFRNLTTEVVVSVDDSKDSRFSNGEWESVGKPAPTSAKKAAPSRSTTKRSTTKS